MAGRVCPTLPYVCALCSVGGGTTSLTLAAGCMGNNAHACRLANRHRRADIYSAFLKHPCPRVPCQHAYSSGTAYHSTRYQVPHVKLKDGTTLNTHAPFPCKRRSHTKALCTQTYDNVLLAACHTESHCGCSLRRTTRQKPAHMRVQTVYPSLVMPCQLRNHTRTLQVTEWIPAPLEPARTRR